MLDIKSELNIKLEKMFKKLSLSFIFDAIFYIFWCIFTSRILKFIQNNQRGRVVLYKFRYLNLQSKRTLTEVKLLTW